MKAVFRILLLGVLLLVAACASSPASPSAPTQEEAIRQPTAENIPAPAAVAARPRFLNSFASW